MELVPGSILRFGLRIFEEVLFWGGQRIEHGKQEQEVLVNFDMKSKLFNSSLQYSSTFHFQWTSSSAVCQSVLQSFRDCIMEQKKCQRSATGLHMMHKTDSGIALALWFKRGQQHVLEWHCASCLIFLLMQQKVLYNSLMELCISAWIPVMTGTFWRCCWGQDTKAGPQRALALHKLSVFLCTWKRRKKPKIFIFH